MTRELIEDFDKIVKPFVQKRLLEENFEGMGEQDKAEFGRDFDEILSLAIKGLESSTWIPVTERLPENATNGDVIKAMFTKGKVRREVSCTHDKTVFSFPDGTYFGAECRFNTDWWNAPYKTESEVEYE